MLSSRINLFENMLLELTARNRAISKNTYNAFKQACVSYSLEVDEREWLFFNPTRPEKTDFQTRPNETRRCLNPTRPDPIFKKFQTRPDPKKFINERMEFVK